MGVPSGPLYGKLKKGEAIQAPNGLTVMIYKPAQYRVEFQCV